MGARHDGREAALCILYQAEQAAIPIGEALTAFFESEVAGERPSAAACAFAERLVGGVDRRRADLDDLIEAGTENWRIERMAVVDRNVLRLALFELVEHSETPDAVILDEAVELAKLFGGEESASFVNGVLDGIRRRLAEGRLPKSDASGPAPE